jgi:hypothetical protein
VLGFATLVVVVAIMAYLYLRREKRREQQAGNVPPPRYHAVIYHETGQKYGREVCKSSEVATAITPTRYVAELPA